MEQLIEQILTESGYSKKIQEIPYYTKEDRSYFFTVSIPEERFIALKNKQLLKEDTSYKIVLDAFKSIITNGEQNAIEKNSSLIVLVKVANISALGTLQQQILLLEEDEYYFKKYVILFTDDSIANLRLIPVIRHLQTKVKNDDNFNQFATEGFVPELAEFLAVIQLFIKLPFLNLEHGNANFTPLSQKIKNTLGSSISSYLFFLENSESLIEIDFTKPENEDSINTLLATLPND